MSQDQVRFVSMPNTENARVYEAVKKYIRVWARKESTNEHARSGKSLSLDDIVLTAYTDSKLLTETCPQNIAIIFIHPAIRLMLAHRAVVSKGSEIDFRSFYSDSKRRNIMSKLISADQLDSLGFIGLSENFHRSILLLENWLNLFAPIKIENRRLHHYSEIDKDLLDDIGIYHRKDFELYEKAKSIFEERWRRYIEKNSKSLNLHTPHKKVLLHVGPPKTGTSAIQSWLLAHSDVLAKQQILYPGHQYGANNVSSGNFEKILSYDVVTGQYQLDRSKLYNLIIDFEQSCYSILLLSSEHFYFHLPLLLKYLPNAEVVFYIRHPLLAYESNYHQDVKRHNKTAVINTSISWRFFALEKMIDIAQDFNVKVHYRYYSKLFYKGGSLISDFCYTCGIENLDTTENKKINSGYNFEALELMRLLNQFTQDETKRELDHWFQNNSFKNESFTLFPAEHLANAQVKLTHQVEKLMKIAPELCAEKLLKLLTDIPSYSFEIQDVFDERFSLLLLKLKKERPELMLKVVEELNAHHGPLLHEEFLTKNLKIGFLKRCKHYIFSKLFY